MEPLFNNMNPEIPRENEHNEEEVVQPTEQLEELATPDFFDGPTEAKEKMEGELSPEDIEKIMEKVQDINLKGTAFSTILDYGYDQRETFAKIMKEGLLGNDPDLYRGSPKDWKDNVKNRRAMVYFNIVGRQQYLDLPGYRDQEGKLEIGENRYMREPKKAAIIFDVSKFKEIVPRNVKTGQGYFKDRPQVKMKSRTFRAEDSQIDREPGSGLGGFDSNTPIDDPELQKGMRRLGAIGFPQGLGKYIDEEGMPKPEDEYGFVLSSRVAPRLFRGIAFRPGIFTKTKAEIEKEIEEDEKKWKYEREDGPFGRASNRAHIKRKNSKEVNVPEIINYQAKQIAEQQIAVIGPDPEKLLPVYDINGNMWWPKQMSYEEVQKFVEERDKEKE